MSQVHQLLLWEKLVFDHNLQTLQQNAPIFETRFL